MVSKENGVSWQSYFDSCPTPQTALLHGTIVFQITVATEDVEKNSFTTPIFLFELLHMPFGLRSAAQTFPRFIDNTARGMGFVHVYVDDLLIVPTEVDEHIQHFTLS